MIRYLLIAASAFGALLLTGCASIINGQNQSVSVVTRNWAPRFRARSAR